MGSVKIPYYTVRHGRGFWEPTKAMRAAGFQSVPCGEDGPRAWEVAQHWAERWRRVRKGLDPAPSELRRPGADPDGVYALRVWPRGSLGEAFGRYRKTQEWAKKAATTREEWDRAWSRIGPVFGDVDPSLVSLEHISGFRVAIERAVSLREAHRCLKVWRAMWKVAAALKYCERNADPSLGVRNTAAKGRVETWSEGEAVRLVKGAWRGGWHGLAAALAVMWDTQLSPGDVRALTVAQLALDAHGRPIRIARAKTGTQADVTLSARARAIVAAYLATSSVELHPTAPLFRTRGHKMGDGRPWPPRPYTKDKFAEDFREVRTAVFGQGEDRKMLDFRRSGAVEAIVGNAEPTHLAHAMGNTLSASNALYETYAPAQTATIKEVAAARRRGRAKLRDENGS